MGHEFSRIEPWQGTDSARLLKMVRLDPGITTRDLQLWLGGSSTHGNLAYVNTLLNAMKRRGLVVNVSKPKSMGRWRPR